MVLRGVLSIVLFSLVQVGATGATPAAEEFAKHLPPLKTLSVEVAEAMPADHWAYKPHPESMNFGLLMAHIATTNYQFCAGLRDSAPPELAPATNREAIIKLLSDSFDYCSGVIDNLTEQQLEATHSSPDGQLTGREALLAMYIHVAHHRGQAEIYLRANGIKPPGYKI